MATPHSRLQFTRLPPQEISLRLQEAFRHYGLYPVHEQDIREAFSFRYSFRLSARLVIEHSLTAPTELRILMFDHTKVGEAHRGKGGLAFRINDFDVNLFPIWIGQKWGEKKPEYVFVTLNLGLSYEPHGIAMCVIKMLQLTHNHCSD